MAIPGTDVLEVPSICLRPISKAKFQGICPQNLALHFTKVAPF